MCADDIMPDGQLQPEPRADANRAETYQALDADTLPGLYKTIVDSLEEGVLLEDDANRIVFVNPALCRLLDYRPEEMIGRHWKFIVAPDWVPVAEAESTLRRQGISSRYENALLTRHGERVPVISSVLPMYDAPSSGSEGQRRLSGVLTVLTDIRQQKQAEAEMEKRNAQLESVRRVALELSSQLDLDTLLESIVAQAMSLLGGTEGSLYLYRPERDALEWVVAISPNRGLMQGQHIRRGQGLAGTVLESRQPLVIDNYTAWNGRMRALDPYPQGAMVAVPVRWGEEFLGVLTVIHSQSSVFFRG